MTQLTAMRAGPRDIAALQRLLERDPIATVYLRSELRLNLASGPWWAIGSGSELSACALGGPLTVPWIPDPSDASALAEAVSRDGLPRMLVGDRVSVGALHDAMRPTRRPRQLRDPQPVLAVDRDAWQPPSVGNHRVRRATRADLEPLILAAAAMHREEMGIDPLAIDAPAWRHRMVTFVDRGWSWVWMDGPEVIFKAEFSAWTPECAQLQGVYVAPMQRRRGVAAAGLAAVVADVLRESAMCALYVNAYNQPALRLYQRLGFTQRGEFATVMY